MLLFYNTSSIAVHQIHYHLSDLFGFDAFKFTEYLNEVYFCKNSVETFTTKSSSSSIIFEKKIIPKSFSTLPIKLLLKIFENLDQEDLRKISLVCQRWRYASQHPSLRKTLKITSKHHLSTNDICFRLGRLQQLTAVHLEALQEPVVVMRQIRRCAPTLKVLILRNCRGITETALESLTRICKHLEYIDLQGTEFAGQLFYEGLSRLKNLRRLNFNDNALFTVRNFLMVVLNCHDLEELQVNKISQGEGERLSDKDVSFLVSNMADTLKIIALDTSGLGNPTFQELFECSKLEQIGLFRANNLSGDTFVKLADNLTRLTQLTLTHALHLRGSDVAQLFTSGKEVVKYLEILDFTGCLMINDDGLAAIAENCPRLRVVTLKSCKSLTVLPSLFRCNKNLEDLNVAFCKMMKARSLLPLPANLKNLFVDDTEKFMEVVRDMKNSNEVKVYLCLSEYNNKVEVF